MCGLDRDLDGWPDHDLGCSDPRCRQVNLITGNFFFLNALATECGFL